MERSISLGILGESECVEFFAAVSEPGTSISHSRPPLIRCSCGDSRLSLPGAKPKPLSRREANVLTGAILHFGVNLRKPHPRHRDHHKAQHAAFRPDGASGKPSWPVKRRLQQM